MWEFYRFLGYVKNYRLLNRTGFSKSTKKMEKVTRIKCQSEYNAKVAKTHFATSRVIDDLQTETETLFGVNFEKGSRKKAVQRLRFMGAITTHHFASWRAGVMLGAALPALVDGIVRACHATTHERIPGTDTRTFHPTISLFSVMIH
jgi:RNase P protein component